MPSRSHRNGKPQKPPRRGAAHAGGGIPLPKPADARRLLMGLLAIPGPSGSERRVIEAIVRKLRSVGVPESAIRMDRADRRSPHRGQIGNLAVTLPGTFRSPRRLLMAHLDTVPLCEGARPVLKGNWIVPADKETALGADDRCGVAVVLGTALEMLRRKLPHPPVTFFWTVQEEIGLHGARYAGLGMLGGPRLAFNFDGGSSEKLTIGATGGYRIDICITGLASHAGATPEEGVSAITIASLAVAELHRNGWHGQIQKNGRQGTSNIGVIRGGQATNVVAPRVDLRAEARSHDPVFRVKIVRAIERAFQTAARRVRNVDGVCGKVEFSGRLDYEAFRLDDGLPCVLAAEAAVRAVGGEPTRSVCNGGLDANWMTARGIPTVTLGCGQVNQHTTAERVDLGEFDRACQIALRLATATENVGRGG